MNLYQHGLNQLNVNVLTLAEYTKDLATEVGNIIQRGAAQKLDSLLRRGWGQQQAIDEVMKTAKGHVFECIGAVDFNRQAKLLNVDVQARINPISNDPLHDLQFTVGKNVIGGVQMKAGSKEYVRNAVKSGKYDVVVANKEAVCELHHLVKDGKLSDTILFQGVKTRSIELKEAVTVGQDAILNQKQNCICWLYREFENELHHLAHNALHSAIYGFTINTIVACLSEDKECSSWNFVMEATKKSIQKSMQHYSISRSISWALQHIAINSPGSVFGRIAQGLLRQGHWISAGLSASLSIWEDFSSYKDSRITSLQFSQNVGRSLGGASGAALGGTVLLRMTANAPFWLQLAAFLFGSVSGSYLGSVVGEKTGELLHGLIHPDMTDVTPYLIHASA